jgi:hypothetical protein
VTWGICVLGVGLALNAGVDWCGCYVWGEWSRAVELTGRVVGLPEHSHAEREGPSGCL